MKKLDIFLNAIIRDYVINWICYCLSPIESNWFQFDYNWLESLKIVN